MPESNNPDVDFGEIKSIIDDNVTHVFKDVSQNDLDWFLRDKTIDDRPFNGSSSSTVKSNTIKNDSTSLVNGNGLPNLNNGLSSGQNSSQKPSSPSPSLPQTAPLIPKMTSLDSANSSSNRTSNLPKIAPASPHLTAVILNTNDNYSTKTKPSVAPIQEEPAMRLNPQSEGDDLGPNATSSMKRKPSLFRKFKERFLKEETPPSTTPSRTSSPSSSSASEEWGGPFKENYRLTTRLARTSTNIDRVSRERSNTVSSSSFINGQGATTNNDPNHSDTYKLKRTMSTPLAVAHNLDPRLEEYIRFYEKGDREIGSHSRRGLMVGTYVAPETPTSPVTPTASKSSIFHRRKSINPVTITANTEKNRKYSDSSLTTDDGSLLRLNSRVSTSEKVPPMFAQLKPLKRVAFHSSTFSIDPPQQIPLRHPRKGNVEVLPNGSIRVNPLSEEERNAQEKSQMGHGGGIVIGGMSSQSGKKALEGETDDPDTKVDLHALKLGIEKPMVVHKHSYLAPVKKMQLDLMYTRCCHLREILPIPTILKQIPPGLMLTIPTLQLRNPAPTMIEVQTFADFIRIAPIMCISLDGISLSLAQFKILLLSMAAKTQLEKLSLRNTPIDSEGWLLLCWFLSRNKVLTRLDITQCPSLQVNVLKKKRKSSSASEAEPLVRMTCNKDNRLDMDWGLFTATLAARGGIDELILTGCCIQDINEFEQLIRIGALVRTARLGLAYSNLLIKQVNILLDYWLLKPFARGIDLGYNDFLLTSFFTLFLDKIKNEDYAKSIAQLNLGFISLNATNIRFLELFKEFVLNFMTKFTNLKYLDLSNNPALFGLTDLTPLEPDEAKPKDETILTTSGLPPADPKQQEKAVTFITLVIPLMSKLIRLHIENNNLSSDSIVQIARTLPLCKNLGYFSVLGNNVNLTAASLLLQSVEYLKTLMMVDCDNDNLPAFVKERLGMYMVRNMERSLTAHLARDKSRSTKTSGEEHDQDPVTSVPGSSSIAGSSFADGLAEQHASLTEQLTEIIAKKADHKLKLEDPEVQLFIAKTKKIRDTLLSVMDELNQLQLHNKLGIDGKEALIRFVFIEASIQRGLLLIDPSLVVDDLAEEQLKRIRIRSSAESHSQPTTDAKDEGNLSVPNDVNSKAEDGTLARRTPLRLNLAQLDRQEGQAFKFRSLRDNLIAQSGGNKDADLYRHFDEKILGEDIRKVLSFQSQEDTDTILKYLEDLRDKKVDVIELFMDKFGDEFRTATERANDKHEYQERIERIRSQWKTMAIERQGLPKDETNKTAKLASSGSESSTAEGGALEGQPTSQADSNNKESSVTVDPKESAALKQRMSTTYDAIITGLEATKLDK